MTTLVTGGAGYIGGHVLRVLRARGDRVVVVDDLSAGVAERVGDAPLIQGDLAADSAVELLTRTMADHGVDAIVHLAARKAVEESVARPDWYRQQNVGGLTNLLAAATAADVHRVVFSSSAAVYASSPNPVAEDDETRPANPYGETKLTGEDLLARWAEATSSQAVSLRYFNVAGSANALLADRGSDNLVPLVFDRIEAGRPPLIFGDDYDTAAGTCVRDFVHVVNVAAAHLVALDALDGLGDPHRVYNVGTGEGTSVRGMIGVILEVTGRGLAAEVRPRRSGDPEVVVADVARIENELGWVGRLDVTSMAESAWAARSR